MIRTFPRNAGMERSIFIAEIMIFGFGSVSRPSDVSRSVKTVDT